MVALYFQNRSGHTEPIQSFTELANVEPTKDFTLLSKEHGVQDLCTDVSKASMDRRSSIRGFNIDLNTPPTSENLNPSPCLQIHPELIETDADVKDGYDNHGPFDHEVEDYSDPNLDKISNDIDDEGTNDDGNVYASTIGNLSRGIIICNDLGDHISIVDPYLAYASEFPEYPDVLLAHLLVVDPKREELFVG
ncbi:hypothetical protein GOBAR_AA03345 [Gossypium barbadense]|uniref:Uncharacterized protein n=1 Tax=Gossypium barbadense TaxID=3634 RepID=A0A2P5YNT4_GOSBA|nr:hypothetical protein GOBAR_AA03345 [Gossypium barbadense]